MQTIVGDFARNVLGYEDANSRELDENCNTKEGGITVEAAVLMPEYIKAEDQKKLFENAKLGDIITFNPKKAYPESDVEVSSLLNRSSPQRTSRLSPCCC